MAVIDNGIGFGTKAVHSGQPADPTTGALAYPIYQTTTYKHTRPGLNKGFSYTRTGNPTIQALADNLAALEGGIGAVCFASGLAAEDAVFRLLAPGDHVLVSKVVYGGTVRLLRKVFEPWGLTWTAVDTGDADKVEEAIQPNTKLLFVETPGNPTLAVSDLAALGAVARDHGLLYVVDNTFHTPAIQRPFEFGADLVVHSTTKWLEGHGTTIGGAVVVRSDKALLERIAFTQNATGNCQSVLDAWLTLRGIQTLGVRLKQVSESALTIARWLQRRPEVARVNYPGLPEFPGYDVNRRQASAAGGVLSFELKGGVEAALRFIDALQLVVLAENLGSTQTLLCHSATMTHAALPREERLAIGIADGLLRISVGLEDVEDIVADLERGLVASREEKVPLSAGGAY